MVSSVDSSKNFDYDNGLSNADYDIDLGGLDEYGIYDDEGDEEPDCK